MQSSHQERCQGSALLLCHHHGPQQHSASLGGVCLLQVWSGVNTTLLKTWPPPFKGYLASIAGNVADGLQSPKGRLGGLLTLVKLSQMKM